MNRSLLALPVLAVALAACGSSGSGAEYKDARSVAAAAHCERFKTQAPELYAADAGQCWIHGHPTFVQWFKDDAAESSWWTASQGAGVAMLRGSGWAFECMSLADCAAVKARVGGST